MAMSGFDPFNHVSQFLGQKGGALGGGKWRAVAISLSGGSFLSTCARRNLSAASSSEASASTNQNSSIFKNFPLRAAMAAGVLALAGDTIAQVVERKKKESNLGNIGGKENAETVMKDVVQQVQSHDYVRSLRMASYGSLLYGPMSHIWYQYLEKKLPGTAIKNLSLKVIANQIFLGPCVLIIVFTWNFAWIGRVQEVPAKLKRDFVPSLIDGWKFWIPASAVNFGMIPLHSRVAYMSTCAIFWNFYLSTLVGKEIPKSK